MPKFVEVIQCVFSETDPMRQLFKGIKEHLFKMIDPRDLQYLGTLIISVQIYGMLHLAAKMTFQFSQ